MQTRNRPELAMWIQHINQRFYYGWIIVIVLMVELTFASGLSFYNHAVILNALSDQPNFTVASASSAVSLFFISGGFAGLWAAKLVIRFDVRICLTIGAVLSSAAIFALGYVKNVWQLYAVYIVFGMGFSGTALIPATTLITHWFQTKRAVALSVASTGLSLGGIIATPISALLVARLGLGDAAPYIAAMYFLGVVPITWIFLRPTPASVNISHPRYLITVQNNKDASDSSKNEDNKLPELDGVKFRQAISSRFFWCFSFAYVFIMMAQVGGIAHQYGLARETLNEQQTAFAVAIIPIASIVGRLAGGWIVELFSMKAFSIAMMAIQAIALLFLSMSSGIVTLCLSLALFGATVGNLLMLQPLLVSEAFGVRSYARIFATTNLMTSWGTAVGPWLVGFCFGIANNNYHLAYLSITIAALLGLILFVCGGKLRQY